MKLIKVCLVLLIVAGFSACEIQGEVVNIVEGTPTKADTVLPRKFDKHPKSELQIEKQNENLPKVFWK